MIICPHCGKPADVSELEKDHLIDVSQVSDQELEVLKLLIRKKSISAERIAFSLWAAVGREEPKSGVRMIAVVIAHIRKKIQKHGFDIRNFAPHGNKAIYGLVKL